MSDCVSPLTIESVVASLAVAVKVTGLPAKPVAVAVTVLASAVAPRLSVVEATPLGIGDNKLRTAARQRSATGCDRKCHIYTRDRDAAGIGNHHDKGISQGFRRSAHLVVATHFRDGGGWWRASAVTRACRLPVCSSVGALENAAIGPGIERGGSGGINR